MQKIAQVLKSNGRDGELLVGFVGIAPEDIDLKEPVFIERDGLPVPFFFESLTPRGVSRALVRLIGVKNLTDADELAGADILSDSYEEEDGEGFLGWTVLDGDGTTVGTASDYEDIPGNLCLWVDTGKGQVLLPLHEDLVLAVDPRRRILTLQIPEGLIPER